MVAQARVRSLAVTGGVLLLMVVTVAALIRYTRRAQKLAQLQMDFVAGVSHELRTPLTTIYTAGYNLQGKVAANPAQVERYGALIQQESGRLKQLVEQILRFATANAGRVIQEREPLSVESIIHETVESTRPLIDQARCVIEQNVDPGLPPILGDSWRCAHALQNLISNAAKYGSDGANWIGISASRIGGKETSAIEIRVADRGPGIPPDEQDQIFDPFFRGSRAVQDVQGLPRLRIRVEPGEKDRRGARGQYPREERADEGRGVHPEHSRRACGGRGMSARILLVEDEIGVALTLSDLLTGEGYEVETAADGPRGLARASSEPFDLVVLDVMLPGKNGFEVCRELRQRGKDVAILMLTGQIASLTIRRVVGLKLRADDYVTKRFEPLPNWWRAWKRCCDA